MSARQDIVKIELFGQLGYGDATLCNELVAEAGLSRRGRPRVSRTKVTGIETLLAKLLVRVCHRGDCRAAARADSRDVVAAANQEACEICGGSVLARRVNDMVACCRRAGLGRLVVVGGSPAYRKQLGDLVAGRVLLRLVKGTVARSKKAARADLAWADAVVVWGHTVLDHAVSGLYQGAPGCVPVGGGGIEHVVEAVTRHARKRTGGLR